MRRLSRPLPPLALSRWISQKISYDRYHRCKQSTNPQVYTGMYRHIHIKFPHAVCFYYSFSTNIRRAQPPGCIIISKSDPLVWADRLPRCRIISRLLIITPILTAFWHSDSLRHVHNIIVFRPESLLCVCLWMFYR